MEALDLAIIKRLTLENKDISKELGISVLAIKNTIHRLLKSLGCTTRTQLLIKVIRTGLVELEEVR